MFKNLYKNGNEKARPGMLRAQRSTLSSVAVPDGCAALGALYPSYSSGGLGSGSGIGLGVGLGSGLGSGLGVGALRALVDALGQGVTQLVLTAKQTGASLCVTRLAECEGVRVRKGVRVCEGVCVREGGRFGACEGAPVEVLRSRVGVWRAWVGEMGSEKISWAVALLANFSGHTGGGGGGGARTAPPRYKCIHIQPTGGMI